MCSLEDAARSGDVKKVVAALYAAAYSGHAHAHATPTNPKSSIERRARKAPWYTLENVAAALNAAVLASHAAPSDDAEAVVKLIMLATTFYEDGGGGGGWGAGDNIAQETRPAAEASEEYIAFAKATATTTPPSTARLEDRLARRAAKDCVVHVDAIAAAAAAAAAGGGAGGGANVSPLDAAAAAGGGGGAAAAGGGAGGGANVSPLLTDLAVAATEAAIDAADRRLTDMMCEDDDEDGDDEDGDECDLDASSSSSGTSDSDSDDSGGAGEETATAATPVATAALALDAVAAVDAAAAIEDDGDQSNVTGESFLGAVLAAFSSSQVEGATASFRSRSQQQHSQQQQWDDVTDDVGLLLYDASYDPSDDELPPGPWVNDHVSFEQYHAASPVLKCIEREGTLSILKVLLERGWLGKVLKYDQAAVREMSTFALKRLIEGAEPHLDHKDVAAYCNELILYGADPNDSRAGRPLLSTAVQRRQVACVRVLLAGGADPAVSEERRRGNTPLMDACTIVGCNGDADAEGIAMVKLLLDHKPPAASAAAAAAVSHGAAAAAVAAAQNNPGSGDADGQQRVPVSTNSMPCTTNTQTNVEGMTALLLAAQCGNHEAVAMLLAANPDLAESRTPRGESGLVLAVSVSHSVDTVNAFLDARLGCGGLKRLLEDGVQGCTPLMIASDAIGAGPAVDHAAAAYCEEGAAIVRALLDKGANVHAADEDGFTALTFAAHSGHQKVVLMLLKAGADKNRTCSDGLPTFYYALVNDSKSSVSLTKDSSGEEPQIPKGYPVAALLEARVCIELGLKVPLRLHLETKRYAARMTTNPARRRELDEEIAGGELLIAAGSGSGNGNGGGAVAPQRKKKKKKGKKKR
eukprot:gene2991-20058_t